jgi:hypothetical protein
MRERSGRTTGGKLLSAGIAAGGGFLSGAVFGSDEQAHEIASAKHTRAAAGRTLTFLRLP